MSGNDILTDEDLIGGAGLIYIQGKRLADGRLQVGEKTVDNWPKKMKVGETCFVFSDEEHITKDNDVQACYFRRDD